MRPLSFDEIIHQGAPLCDCLIKRNMSLSEVLTLWCEANKALQKQVSLREVNLQEMGIDNTCDLTYENLLTEVLNALHGTDVDIRKELATINKAINNILSSSTTSTDEKVKTNAADAQPGFLADKVRTLQPGTIEVAEGKVTFVGFVPVGACFFVSRARLSDFDQSGKGKSGTDLWGYAISNGQNGTTNRLGTGVPRYVGPSELNAAGNSGGVAEISIKKENLETMELPVSGLIDGNLGEVDFSFRYNTNKIKDGSGGDTYLMRGGTGLEGGNTMKTLSRNLFHTHSFNLIATLHNPAPVKIPLVPQHILEIPIERITV